jgi:hypothetical protein
VYEIANFLHFLLIVVKGPKKSNNAAASCGSLHLLQRARMHACAKCWTLHMCGFSHIKCDSKHNENKRQHFGANQQKHNTINQNYFYRKNEMILLSITIITNYNLTGVFIDGRLLSSLEAFA